MSKLFIAVCLLFCMGCGSIYVIEASGEVERYEYLNGGWGTYDKTVVYFKDGGSYIIPTQIPMKTGKIKIIKCGIGEYRIETY